MEKKSNKPIVIAIITVILLAAAATAVYFIWFRDKGTQTKKDGKLVYVESVESITGAGYLGLRGNLRRACPEGQHLPRAGAGPGRHPGAAGVSGS